MECTEHRFLMLKSLCETRCCARADVLRAQIARKEIKNAFEDLIEDYSDTHTPDTRITAEGSHKTLESFQTTLLTVICGMKSYKGWTKPDELFPTSTFNKPLLSPTSQRKPGCFSSSKTLTLPGTINIYNMGWRLASRAICPATDSDNYEIFTNSPRETSK
ncbi:hypothetical protein TNCV_2863421 [Trichonephila clavipes]|nr:hypothetical protein TNCV_2863421 [Trichonephila clavipes]